MIHSITVATLTKRQLILYESLQGSSALQGFFHASNVVHVSQREDEIWSKNIRILSPKNGGYRSRKGHLVEKTSIFDVFGKSLIDKWLHGFQSVNGRFTKSEFAKGKVLVRERLCFAV